ncbi:ADP-ribosyltransferase [Streptomyces phage JustBecause]|nr:ADP-ribosyltransferase [Streptomyces phage JustBecause]
MPLIWTSGNLLESQAQGLVNPVNCVGVPGAGLARQFRDRWPAQVEEYVTFCREGKMRPGRVHDAVLLDGRRILSIATKRHWRDNSRIEDVDLGLAALKEYLDTTGLISVAVPALGCGLGGLPKALVARRVQFWLADNFSVVYIYGLDEPEG